MKDAAGPADFAAVGLAGIAAARAALADAKPGPVLPSEVGQARARRRYRAAAQAPAPGRSAPGVDGDTRDGPAAPLRAV